jgi:putative acetyltransferase
MDPPADILIRAMEPADIPAVAEVLSQPRAVWGTLQPPFVSIDARQKRQAEHGPNDAGLVAVHDAYTGRGAGRALLAAVVDLAEKWWNIRRLELNVYADNHRAIALYERFGFEREGLHRAYAWRDGAYVDSLSMARVRL